MSKFYVGIQDGLKRKVFRSIGTPVWETHGTEFLAVIGPFRTKAGAEFMRDFGQGNPHCCNVRQAEYLARKIS